MKHFAIIILISVLTFSCSKNKYQEENFYKTPDFQTEQTPQQEYIPEKTPDIPEQIPNSPDKLKENIPKNIERKIIYNANISVASENPDSFKNKIYNKTKELNGYIQREDYSVSMLTVSMVIKVPAKHFQELLDFIKENAYAVKGYNISTEDITDTYYDIKQRIKIKQELEKQYLELLKKARTMKDMLEIQRYLNGMRGEIERLQGKIKMYDKLVAYSTIEVSISPKGFGIAGYEPSFIDKLVKSFSAGFKGLEYLLLGIVALWPLWILVAIIIFVIRKLRRRKKT